MEYYPRKIDEILEKWLKRKENILIKGSRQSGKTTLFLLTKVGYIPHYFI
jgi:predicted AAA+ superfamily ATPase